MGNKWNEFFEKQARDDLKTSTPPNPNVGDVSVSETEKAGENAEKDLNESANENKNENENENETEKKGTEKNEGSKSETGKETV